jgi:hypothetical protein
VSGRHRGNPRGSVIRGTLSGAEETARITVAAKGTNAKLAGHLPFSSLERQIIPRPARRTFRHIMRASSPEAANMTLNVATGCDLVVIEAVPHPAEATTEALAL